MMMAIMMTMMMAIILTMMINDNIDQPSQHVGILCNGKWAWGVLPNPVQGKGVISILQSILNVCHFSLGQF